MHKIQSINSIIKKYDNFIIDQWGVMHDGSKGYVHAIQTIDYLYKKNKKLFIISNSSKRELSSKKKLHELGFKKDFFLRILTSGEMIWNTLKNKYLPNEDIKTCFHIYDHNKEDEILFRDGLNLNFNDDINKADLILACTPFNNMQPIDYIPILNTAIDKQLLMYCANPDFETIDNITNQNKFCMGTIAEIYKRMGGEVIIQGKPEIDIYTETMKSIKFDKSRTVSVGDSLFHDIKGANNFGIDSILIRSGIHKKLDTIKNIIKIHQIEPTYIIDDFSI